MRENVRERKARTERMKEGCGAREEEVGRVLAYL